MAYHVRRNNPSGAGLVLLDRRLGDLIYLDVPFDMAVLLSNRLLFNRPGSFESGLLTFRGRCGRLDAYPTPKPLDEAQMRVGH